MTEKNKPVHKIPSRGGISMAIWKNDGQNGPFYTVTFDLSYKQGEKWKVTNAYHHQDLLNLGKMLDEAETWIANEQAKAKAAGQARDEEQPGFADREDTRKRAVNER